MNGFIYFYWIIKSSLQTIRKNNTKKYRRLVFFLSILFECIYNCCSSGTQRSIWNRRSSVNTNNLYFYIGIQSMAICQKKKKIFILLTFTFGITIQSGKKTKPNQTKPQKKNLNNTTNVKPKSKSHVSGKKVIND